MILNLVIAALLLIVVAFDVKTKKVPAVLTTAILLILSIVNLRNLEFGIISFIFAWLLYEFDFIGGLADVKVISIIGLMISNVYGVLALMILVTIYGTIYRASVGLILKRKTIAFTLPLLLIYFTMWAGGII